MKFTEDSGGTWACSRLHQGPGWGESLESQAAGSGRRTFARVGFSLGCRHREDAEPRPEQPHQEGPAQAQEPHLGSKSPRLWAWLCGSLSSLSLFPSCEQMPMSPGWPAVTRSAVLQKKERRFTVRDRKEM